jgi:hypothetical protein
MTVENKSGSAADGAGSAGDGESGTGSVSREAYQRVLDQRKADRDRAKAAEEKATQLQAEKDAAEAEKLAQANEYKKLFEAEKKKREEVEGRMSQMTQAQVTRAKTDALKAELGISKTEYLNFADLAAVQMNDDGTVEPESIKTVANKFRESYPDLLPSRSGGRLPQNAPAGTQPKLQKKISEMNPAELREAYANLRSGNK